MACHSLRQETPEASLPTQERAPSLPTVAHSSPQRPMLRGLEPTEPSSPRECFGSTTCPGLVTRPWFFLQTKAPPFPWRAICFLILIKVCSAPTRAEGECQEGLGSGPQAQVKLPWCMQWGPSSHMGDSDALKKKNFTYFCLCWVFVAVQAFP